MSVVICITSGCGGQGCSAFAASLTRVFAAMGHKAALVDAKSGAGALDSMLGTKATAVYNLGDVLTDRCELSDAVCRPFEDAVFFPAAKNADDAPLLNLAEVLDHLDKFDYTIIDMPRAESKSADILFSCSDMVILCGRPEDRELQYTYSIRRRMQRIGVDTRLVLDLVDSDALEVPNLDYCIDQSRTRLLGVIPRDRAFAQAMAKGEDPEGSGAYEAVKRIARRIAGERLEIPKL